jgi:predicted TIM-barrel fold metal-dependent hydrolase
MPSNGAVPEYRLLQKRIGTTRSVVVQPRHYAIDNAVTLDALAQFAGNARGVVVVHPTVTDAELKRFDAAGVRGIRFSLGDPATAVVKPDMIERLAQRIAPLGWHIQFNVDGEQVVELAPAAPPAHAARVRSSGDPLLPAASRTHRMPSSSPHRPGPRLGQARSASTPNRPPEYPTQ